MISSTFTARQVPTMVAVDRSWYEAMEEDRAMASLASDPSCARRQRLLGPVRVATVLAVVIGCVALYRVVEALGVGAGLLAIWLLPMLVLGVATCVERLLLLLTR
jgi:hypothetical protein